VIRLRSVRSRSHLSWPSRVRIRFNEHIEGDGPTVFAHACKIGLEGIVSKRKDSAYRSGRSSKEIAANSWLLGDGRMMANARAERLLKIPEPSLELRIPALQLKREWSPWPEFWLGSWESARARLVSPAQASLPRSWPTPELRIPNAAAQTRIVSKARIRLDSCKSVRSFKGIICVDISEFESYMPSHAVGSLCAHDAAVAQTAGPEGDRAFACRRLNRNDRFILGAGLLLYSTRNRDDFCPRNAGRSRRKEVANSIHVEHGGHQRRAVARTGSQ
jgi:hypothetical protein